MNSSFTPHAFELDMRDKNAVVLDFGEQYKLTFGGVVDRVDVCEIDGQNYICIVDYKSSQKKITPVTLGSGIDLQMLLYLFAATDRGGVYEGYEPAGVLYSPIQISAVESDDYKIDSLNSSVMNSALKTSGLVISDKTVLEAMEAGIAGKYIPVKLLKSGEFDRYSTCISKGGIKSLRDFTYSKLIKMAESLLSGDAEAEPLVKNKENPCEYCGYVNICDNSRLERYKTPDVESVAEAEKILSRRTDDSEEEEE
jgi:ATP-dependent nuclease subunit B